MREIYWIAEYNGYYNGYNSTPGGQGKYYDPQSIYDAWDEGLSPLEISKKLGIGTSCIYYNLKEYKNYNKHEAKIRGGRLAYKTVIKNKDNLDVTIYQYDLNGKFIRDWPSCKEITRNHPDWDSSYIGKVLAGKRKTAYGYQWLNYYDDNLPPYKNNRTGKAKPIIQYDLNGNEIQYFDTMAEACKKFAGDTSLLRRACNDFEHKTAYGYKWKWTKNE